MASGTHRGYKGDLMHLTQQTDVAMRILLSLALYPEQVISVSEISRRFRLSSEHTAKVAKRLVREGLLVSKRGRLGGLMLAVNPKELRLGQLLKQLEPMELLDCMDRETDCPIEANCAFNGALRTAMHVFLNTLDTFTLADLAENRSQLIPLLTIKPKRVVA